MMRTQRKPTLSFNRSRSKNPVGGALFTVRTVALALSLFGTLACTVGDVVAIPEATQEPGDASLQPDGQAGSGGADAGGSGGIGDASVDASEHDGEAAAGTGGTDTGGSGGTNTGGTGGTDTGGSGGTDTGGTGGTDTGGSGGTDTGGTGGGLPDAGDASPDAVAEAGTCVPETPNLTGTACRAQWNTIGCRHTGQPSRPGDGAVGFRASPTRRHDLLGRGNVYGAIR